MNKRIGINVITNLTAMTLSILINFLIAPILTKSLGISAYSYVGIITNILSFFTVLTYTLNSMVGRFYTFSYNNDKAMSNKYISSALFSCLFISILLFPVLTVFSYKLDFFINIDADLVSDVKLAFFLSSLTFLLGTVASVFSTGAYCKNRLEISNIVNIIGNIFKLLCVFLLFKLFKAHIWYIGISTILQFLICIALGYVSFKKLIPEVKFSVKLFDIYCTRNLLTAGLLNSVILLGRTLMTQIDLLVGNRFIRGDIIGEYAVILLFANTLRSISSALSSAFSPTTVNSYAKGDMTSVVKYSNMAVGICGIALGWPIAIIASLGIYFMSFWLNKDFSEFKYIIFLMMIPLMLNLAVSQLNVINQAANKLKLPAAAATICGIINFILAVLLAKPFGIWGIAAASVIAYTLNNLVFLPVYTAQITGQKIYVYYLGLVKPFISCIATSFIGFIAVNYFGCGSMLIFLFQCLILTLVYIAIIFFLLNKEQKKYLILRFVSIVNPRKFRH